MYILTRTGRRFYYNNITKDSIDIEDVFESLPRLNRFVGHSTRAYSVGEHTFYCLLMAKKLGYSIREQLLVFLHDFTETYVGDCPAPLKRLLPEFEVIEGKVEEAIYDHLEIEHPTEEEYLKIKRVDLTMLVIEMKDLTMHDYKEFINEYTYEEFLEDDEFNLKALTPSEKDVNMSLRYIFDKLMKQYKENYNG